ncbi:MAG: chorismate mutase [Eubacterium sp.]|nr:chorismate mutase [Eubacterium sp.]
MIELNESRKRIDEIDKQIVSLFEERMAVVGDIAEYKINSGTPVLDSKREEEKLDSVSSLANSDFNKKAIRDLFKQILSISREYQNTLIRNP